ncbi:type I-C CRISPR-associated protein Cas5c [Lachnobacterium bovis]|uniref:pre-crRNA processing endonuclease n=1 Tax=Lachnobacterium bovis DSM 14045 TaxID=1122142 RepID=A0A1H3MRA0_9FIRM|nr:type I-C CRISPR-associated protein Cas5c [Lachnobacterium bovis]SDY78609.1 CRISPR-associated protein Cas5d [Lachnobacterium bovis DSM 14045]
MKTEHSNIVEFEITGKNALFSDPIMRVGGEKCSYQIPTYEAIKGILASVYWKPTIIWFIDEVRIMNHISMETKGIRPIKMNGGNDLSYYTYLKNVRYQVRAHFEWNDNRPELEMDRNENKHHNIAKRMIKKGGRRDIFLGTRECQGYVEPCTFGSGKGAYDAIDEISFGEMYHGITYPDEAYDELTKNKITINFWRPSMKNGIINFCRPEECSSHKTVRDAEMKIFENKKNFIGIEEFKEVD